MFSQFLVEKAHFGDCWPVLVIFEFELMSASASLLHVFCSGRVITTMLTIAVISKMTNKNIDRRGGSWPIKVLLIKDKNKLQKFCEI